MRYFSLFFYIFGCYLVTSAQDEIIVASSSWQQINTFSLFGNNNSPARYKLIVASSSWQGINTVRLFENKQERVVYFDKQDRITTEKNAYYFRRAKFNELNYPEGIVQDYYMNGLKKKFAGSYFTYNIENEKINDKFQGLCDFYGEDDTKTTKLYQNGILLEEKKIDVKGKLIYEVQYNQNKTRKYYEEHFYDEKSNEIAVIQGRYNPSIKTEEFRKRLFSIDGKTLADIDYVGECPKSKATYYYDNNNPYPVYLQEFSCEPNNEWTFANFEIFDRFFDKSRTSYQLKSKSAGEAFLYFATPNEFQKKPFEINATFERPTRNTVPEFGITWHFQDNNNYSYFLVNLENQTFEVNSKVNGEFKKYMIGIRNQITISNNTPIITLQIIADPTNNSFKYFVNNQQLIGYNKFPTALAKESKIWNIGYILKTKTLNDAIELKKFEIKML